MLNHDFHTTAISNVNIQQIGVTLADQASVIDLSAERCSLAILHIGMV